MRSCVLTRSIAAVAFILAVAPPSAEASTFSRALFACGERIAKEATRFVAGRLTLDQRCKEAALAAGETCSAPDPVALDKLRTRLRTAITRACDPEYPGLLRALGFPGPCLDPVPGDGFTIADLLACIETSHSDGTDAITAELFDPTIIGPLGAADASCQHALGTNGRRLTNGLMLAVQHCRNGIRRGEIAGVVPRRCATDHPPTAALIAKREADAADAITARCTDAQLITLGVCDDRSGIVPIVDCLLAAIRQVVDDPVVTNPPDLIDYEYAEPSTCGDQRRNALIEECDGPDDRACPGQCGARDGLFACLCQNLPRLRVVEHANADLDLGWTGVNHDSRVTAGGGYLADLWDCDGSSDVDCHLGPTCSLPPHDSCGSVAGAPYTTGDAICAGLGQGVCRKTVAGAMGPHCEIDFQQECASDAECTIPGDRCVRVPHGPPVPLSAGGISACIASVFTEDVVGTTSLATGASTVRVRQQLTTHLGPAIDQPCPVCGGFCAAPAGGSGPGARTLCSDDTECPGSFCVLDRVCSYGPDADQPCRPDPPFGGPAGGFGNPSVDCRPNADIGHLDVLFAPSTTGTATLTADVRCDAAEFRGKTCFQGADDGRPCTADADCPGGACHDQCFCPASIGAPQRPNACNAACVVAGGASPDGDPCDDDADCPGGFCHPADCRVNPLDDDSSQEGRCTAGPIDRHCSTSIFKTCLDDAQCAPPVCPFCEPGEVCAVESRQCFVNGQIVRAGAPGAPDRVSVATFCVPASNYVGLNSLAGWPGPGAITQPETTIAVGF